MYLLNLTPTPCLPMSHRIPATPAERVATRAGVAAYAAADVGGVLNSSVYVPTLHYERMTASTYQPRPVVPLSSYRPTVTCIVWLPPDIQEGAARVEIMDEYNRAKLAAVIMLKANHRVLSGTQRLSWILTAFELLLPGSAQYIAPPGTVLERRRIGIGAWNLHARGEYFVPGENGAPGAWADVPDNLVADLVATEVIGEFEITGEVDFPADFSSLDAGAILGQLIYTVVKTPTDLNSVGFTARRPRAAAASVGRTGNFPASLVPPTTLLAFAGSVFTGNPSLREAMCIEVVNWVLDGGINAMQGAIVAQARLWRGHGLSGLFMVRDMMINIGGLLREVAPLSSEITWYQEHLERYTACTQLNRDYRNAIFGPRSDVASRGVYKNLVTLARDMAVSGGATSMANFGARGGAGDQRLVVPAHIRTAITAAATNAEMTSAIPPPPGAEGV
uniref:Uncharacterized protein n=1 Tax=Rhizoctonia cerealis phyllomonavirus TaxID=3068671 RepID=A0AA51GH24_9MONO|nr:MAG: hypothetical protein [Rhizoctonia cerealis phyllomonavirus]